MRGRDSNLKLGGSVSLIALALALGCQSAPPSGSPAQSPQSAAPASSPAPAASSASPAAAAVSPLASAVPAASAPADVPRPNAPRSPAIARAALAIAVIGDSLTDPKSNGGGYLDAVRKRCPDARIDNFARGGFMVNQMRRRFDEQVLSSGIRYTHLIVFGGVNDLYSDLTALRTPAKIEADLSYMYGAARARGMRVVALSVAPWGGFTRYFNESRAAATHALNSWIRERPAAGQVDAVVDAFALLSCGDADVLCERYAPPFRDGIHFGPAGHALLGDALVRAAFSECG